MFIDAIHGKQLFEIFHGTVHLTTKEVECGTQQQCLSHVCCRRIVYFICAQLYYLAVILAFNLTQCSLVWTALTK